MSYYMCYGLRESAESEPSEGGLTASADGGAKFAPP